MDDCNSVENMWTSCLLVEAWVVSVTLYHLCPNLFVYYNIHYKVRDRYRKMAQRLRALALLSLSFFGFGFFETGFLCVALPVLELTL